MNRFCRILLFGLTLSMLGSPPGSDAAMTSLGGETPVEVQADQFWLEGDSNTYRAIGDVHIKVGDLELSAAEVSWDAESGDAIASGGVEIVRPGSTLKGEFMNFNLNSGMGVLSRGDVFLEEDGFSFSGERISRTGERDFSVERGRFTSCDPEDPDWQFVASHLDVHNARWVSARHVRFHVADIPVLYLPYLVYPIRYERESGFLEPEIGYSSLRGNQVSLLYYWAIAQNMDASISLDYLSDIGLGKGLEYRYAFSKGNLGSFDAYHVNGYGDKGNSHAFAWEHVGWLPAKVRLLADTEYVSSREYLEDFGGAAEEYNKDFTRSTLALTRNWQRSVAGVRFDYTQDLVKDDKTLLQQIPRIDLSRVRSRQSRTPLFFAVDSSATRFWREEGQRGTRVQIRPLVAADFHLGRFVSLDPEAAYRQRFYSTQDPQSQEETFGVPEFALRAKSELSRSFPSKSGGPTALRHVIEPRLEYHYRPREDLAGLPVFDIDDITPSQNYIEVALVNRLFGRVVEADAGDVPVYHEYLQLRVAQKFDIDEYRREVLSGEERNRPWGGLRTELIVRPTLRSYLDIDSRFDVNSGAKSFDRRTLELDSRAGYSDPQGNGVALGYYYQREGYKYLSGSLTTTMLDPVHVSFLQRFDFRDNRNLERSLKTEYRSECWSLALTLTERPGDKSFMVSFALGGFGELAEMGGGF